LRAGCNDLVTLIAVAWLDFRRRVLQAVPAPNTRTCIAQL